MDILSYRVNVDQLVLLDRQVVGAMKVVDSLRDLGPTIRGIRKAKGLSLERLAEQIDMRPGTIQNIEAGTRLPTLDIARTLLDWAIEAGGQINAEGAAQALQEPIELPDALPPLDEDPGPENGSVPPEYSDDVDAMLGS